MSDAYEPGSTFKMVTAAAALEEGLIDPDELLDCEMGGITLAGVRIADHKAFGTLTFRDVIAKSSNVGTIKTSLRLSNASFYDAIRAFGFGRTSGLDLPGESPGLLMPVARWPALAKAYISFGQGISITPLQLALAFGAVANGGRLLEPYLVRQSGSGAGARGPPRRAGGARPSGLPPNARRGGRAARRGDARGWHRQGRRRARLPGGRQDRHRPEGGARQGLPRERVRRQLRRLRSDRRIRRSSRSWSSTTRAPVYHGGEVAAPVFAAIAQQALLYLNVPPQRDRPERWPGEPEPPSEEETAPNSPARRIRWRQPRPEAGIVTAGLEAGEPVARDRCPPARCRTSPA